MYLSDTQNGPSGDLKYVSHIYRYEHPFRYQMREKVSPNYPIISNSGYHFLSDNYSCVNPEQPQTVEQIVEKGYFAVPPGDSITAVVSDKKHSSRIGLDDLIGQIRQRYQIYDQNIYELKQSECSALNVFHRHVCWYDGIGGTDRQYYSLNKRLQTIYQMKRDERVRLWQDISRLKEKVSGKILDYLAAYRKMAVLDDDGGVP